MSGPGPGSGGPFYFHYVADATIGFSSDCYSEDETIFSFGVKHDEGQIPVVEFEIKNPEVGLLSGGRKQWMWFSWWNGESVVPLFFGRLVGVPSDLFAQVIKVQFIARAPDYISRKQALAETLKTAPNYDPVFLDDAHRDDPDAILEAWSAMYHIDRISLAWTVSDILIGEDGAVTFDGATAFYDDLQLRIGEPPFTAIRVEMSAKWAQIVSGGSIDLAPWVIPTFTGEKLISDWPKPGASLGGGWFVRDSGVYDTSGVIGSTSISSATNWRNEATKHVEGDTMSLSQSYSRPSFVGLLAPPPWSQETKRVATSGVGHSSLQVEWNITPKYNISGFMGLQYQANRKRSERIGFTLTSDLQPVLTDPTVQQDSEVIQLNTVTLSDPLITPTNWTALAGQAVAVGQVCFPNNPTLPAQSSFYICIVAGTCGATEPAFSDIVGDTTTDGGVTWACMGASLPAIGDWQGATAASLGTIIAPSTPVWIYYSALTHPFYPTMSIGASVSVGTIIRADDGSSYQMCIVAGKTVPLYNSRLSGTPAFSPVWGVTTTDGTAQWISLGPNLPAGTFHLCIQAGTTSTSVPPVPPPWSATPGNVVVDGSVHWYSLGSNPPSISIPAGGQVGNVTTRSYFTTDRGRQSLEYGLMKARAHLRKKARCAEISFVAPFASGVALSCRKSAVIEDPRLPHGSASGKIISYALSCDGDSGDALTKVTIGCAVGTGGTALAVDPTDTYFAPGYFDTGYFEDVGASILVGSDLGYAPPADNPNDDGLTFPLTAEQVVISNQIMGNPDDQEAQLAAAWQTIISKETAASSQFTHASSVTDTAANSPYVSQQMLAALAARQDVYLDLQLKNLTGSSFTTVYEIATTPLQIPQQINLG
jgi:hypothetical protein